MSVADDTDSVGIERGSILLVAMIMIVVLTVVGGAFLTLTDGEQPVSTSRVDS